MDNQTKDSKLEKDKKRGYRKRGMKKVPKES